MSGHEKACCGLAAKLGTAKLAELDAELRRPNHRSFRKLAAELDVRHNAVERHKKGCLKLGEAVPREVRTFEAPETKDLPPIRQRPTRRRPVSHGVPSAFRPDSGVSHEVSQVSLGTGDGTASVPSGTAFADGTEPALTTRAPAHGSENPSERRRNRVLEIVAAMSDGTWDTPRDNVAKRAAEWGVSRGTVEDMVREASVGAAVDPETVRTRRAVALGRWGWGVQKARAAIEDGPAGYDTMSKLLSAYAQMQTGWDKAAGVLDESPKVVNVIGHPVFTGMLESVLLAVAQFPEARAAVMAAVKAKLDVLRQPVPAALGARAPVEAIETTEEAA